MNMMRVAEATSKPEAIFARTGFQRSFIISLLCLFAAYIGIAIYFASFHVFWSPDSGGRFAMIRSWVEHGRLIHFHYAQEAIDPSGQISSLAYFLYHQPRGYSAMYEPLFPLLSGVFYRIFGFGGLLVIPVLSGLGTASLIAVIAKRLDLRSSRYLMLIAGLATPLLIYSVVF